jgi:hypothetical protein
MPRSLSSHYVPHGIYPHLDSDPHACRMLAALIGVHTLPDLDDPPKVTLDKTDADAYCRDGQAIHRLAANGWAVSNLRKRGEWPDCGATWQLDFAQWWRAANGDPRWLKAYCERTGLQWPRPTKPL